MSKILSINQAIDLSHEIHKQNKTIVMAGGCFDILPVGRILFLEAAKKEGDFFFLLLESDKNIEKKKGKGRPINSQKHRSLVLSAISYVDYIILLKGVTNSQEYDKLMVQINPNVVAMTKGDPGLEQRKKQVKITGAKIKLVIDNIKGKSTTDLINKNG